MPIYQLKPGKNAIQAAYYRIKFKDIFDLKEFYAVIKDWLLEYGWMAVDSSGGYERGGAAERFETLYWEKEDGNGMKEQWWWWRLQKPSENPYYKYHLDIDYHNLAITNTEVVRDGKKFKVQKGETEIKVWTFVEYDVGGIFSKNKWMKSFQDLYSKRIMGKDLHADKKIELYRETYILQSFMKRWFQLKRFLPYEEVQLFHPSKAFPGWKK